MDTNSRYFRQNNWIYLPLAPIAYGLSFIIHRNSFRGLGFSDLVKCLLVSFVWAALLAWTNRNSVVEVTDTYVCGNNGAFGRSTIMFSKIVSMKRVGGRIGGLYIYSDTGERIIARDQLERFDELEELMRKKIPHISITAN